MSLVGGGHLQGYWNSCLLKCLLSLMFKKNFRQILSLHQIWTKTRALIGRFGIYAGKQSKQKKNNTALCLKAHSSRHIQAVKSILCKDSTHNIGRYYSNMCVHCTPPYICAFPDSIWLNVFSLPRANENPITLPNLLAEKQTKKSFTRA